MWGKNGAEPLPYWVSKQQPILFFKTFYDNYCSAKAKAVNGNARILYGVSRKTRL